MMKIITYWLIGCLIVGIAWGDIAKKCPNDDIKAEDLFIAVVLWPAIIVAAIKNPSPINKKITCKK